ncbi:MAG: 4-phosphopantoate--beta-alanine ligase [Candidatus Micrarchaeota archaeon]
MKPSKLHPRYKSLHERESLARGVRSGIASVQGLIAHGRGEAFDYLLGERTTKTAERAEEAAAAALLLAKHPAISVNGNVAALCPKEIVALARAARAKIEVNLFHRTQARAMKIAKLFARLGAKIEGVHPDKTLPQIHSARARVSSQGIWRADVVLVPLEDGDRTAALKKLGKKVIAIDLNPLSRTAMGADITIVDNITRALPNITKKINKMKNKSRASLERALGSFNNARNLRESERIIRSGRA